MKMEVNTFKDLSEQMKGHGLFIGEGVLCANEPEVLGRVVCREAPSGKSLPAVVRIVGFEDSLGTGGIYRGVKIWPFGKHPVRDLPGFPLEDMRTRLGNPVSSEVTDRLAKNVKKLLG